MKPEEMLQRIGITPEEAEQYHALSSQFDSSLSARSERLASFNKKLQNPVPRHEVRNWFGEDVTNEDLELLYRAAPALSGVIVFSNLDDPRKPPIGR
jgi:hypothetical protein